MSLVTVDIGGLEVSTGADDVIVTYALGSCIAVMVHDPVRVAAGMVHYMLPLSETSPEKAKDRPGMFADTGIPALFRAMYGRGCRKQDLVVKVAGGAALYDDNGVFRIGERNYAALRQIFAKAGVVVRAEDVGGAKSRTARLHVATGRCTISSRGEEVAL